MPDPARRPPRLTVVERRRPDPPPELSEREAALWTAIVNSRPVAWLNNPGAMFTLGLYCRAVITCEDLCDRARRDVAFIPKVNRQTSVVLRLGKQLGLLPIHRPPRPPRPRVIPPPWSA